MGNRLYSELTREEYLAMRPGFVEKYRRIGISALSDSEFEIVKHKVDKEYREWKVKYPNWIEGVRQKFRGPF